MALAAATIGALGWIGSALTGDFSRARTTAGVAGAANLSAPLLAMADVGFGSLIRWGGCGAGDAGFADASGC
jgi:hypothetical protein